VQELDPFAGKLIGRRYRLLRLLAKGGMGRVYEAEQLSLKRPVAVKVMAYPVDPGELSVYHKRFEREAEILSRLQSPHTVSVIDYGEDRGVHFIVMELLEGATLRRLIDQSAPFDPRRAVNLAMQMAEGLVAAHRNGIVHRDLKPGNVIVCAAGDEEHVKLVDFGIGKRFLADQGGELTHQGMVLGSPLYMAPEQFVGAAPDPRTDIYGLGLCLWEMLTGRSPFAGRPTHPPVPLPLELTKIPLLRWETPLPVTPSLEALVSRCLARELEDRPKTMAEVLSQLRAMQLRPAAEVGRRFLISDDLEDDEEDDSPTRVVDLTFDRAPTGEVQGIVARPSDPPLDDDADDDRTVTPSAPRLRLPPTVTLGLGAAVISIVFIGFAVGLMSRGDRREASPAEVDEGRLPVVRGVPVFDASPSDGIAGDLPETRGRLAHDGDGLAGAPAGVAEPAESYSGSGGPGAGPSASSLVLFEVTSEPSGATVEVDGVGIGQTPLTYATTALGEVAFSFSLEGYGPVEARASGDGEGSASVHAALPSLPDPESDEADEDRGLDDDAVRRRRRRSARASSRGGTSKDVAPEAQTYRDNPYD
jgi:serine/threonine protein kinase